MSSHYSIWIVSLPGYPHSRCFEEIALALQEAFRLLGFAVPIVTDPAAIQGQAIVLGANLLPMLPAPPPNLILFNLEQIQPGSAWLKPAYIELLRRYPLWDYSASNIEKLKQEYNIVNVALCGIGYMPALTRIAPAEEDIDVLFIGSRSARRMHILEEIARHGRKVVAVSNGYGKERDDLIARAKIVLNIHFYESQVLEIVRISYLLANKKCVVSEVGYDRALEAPLTEGIAFASYAEVVSTCLRLLDDTAERARFAARGFECFSALPQLPMLQRALTSLAVA